MSYLRSSYYKKVSTGGDATSTGTQTWTNKTFTDPKTDTVHSSTSDYTYIKPHELNSLGVLDRTFFGATYTLTTNIAPSGSTSTQLTSWRKMNAAAAGAADADPFARFLSNEWNPSIAGYYLLHLCVCTNAADNVAMYANIRRSIDGGSTSEDSEGNVLNERGAGQSTYQSMSASGILACDTNDTIEFWGRIDQTGKIIYRSGSSGRQTSFAVTYMGSNAL